MFPILQLGPLAIQTPGLLLLASLWLGLWLSEKTAPRYRVTPDQLYNLAFTILVAGIIGARVGYILQNPSYFSGSLISYVSPDWSLLDPFSGMAFGLLAGFIYGYKQRLGLRDALDALTPAIATLMVGLGLANLASGAGYGSESSLPWAIQLNGAMRHPSQVYESLAAGFLLFWVLQQVNKGLLPAGHLFLIFIALTAGSILLLEAFRGDSTLLAGGFRANQVFAWLILAASLFGLSASGKTPAAPGEPGQR